jgi:hypothetical protein
VAAPRKRGRRGSSEPPPTYAPTQPPGRGDGDRKRSRQVIDRLAEDGRLRLLCRNGKDITASYPELACSPSWSAAR